MIHARVAAVKNTSTAAAKIKHVAVIHSILAIHYVFVLSF